MADSEETMGWVRRSDAIVIGRLTRQLRTEQEPGGNNDPTRYYYEFTDCKLLVERPLQPTEGLHALIAVLAETGIVAANGVDITDDGVVAECRVGEWVLLLLERLDGKRFGPDGVPPVPEGYARDDYYLTIVDGRFGKMVLRLMLWMDSGTHLPVTVGLVENVVKRHGEGR